MSPMRIERPKYLQWLESRRGNGRIKVITGIRRCGKSYLLSELFRSYLLQNGILNDHILYAALDQQENHELLNPLTLDKYIRSKIQDDQPYIIIVDEIQRLFRIVDPMFTDNKIVLAKEDDPRAIWFPQIVSGWLNIPNADIYITGSNSKFLSSDIDTILRDRNDDIHVLPLTLSEILPAFPNQPKNEIIQEYLQFGGMPLIFSCSSESEKRQYLANLLQVTYTADLIERYKLRNKAGLQTLISVLAGSMGSQVNPRKIADTFRSNKIKTLSEDTISRYLLYLEEAFLIQKAIRLDLRGRQEIGALAKFYFADPGLWRAAGHFRTGDMGHALENVIYNELVYRNNVVMVGTFPYTERTTEGKKERRTAEIDFAAIRFSRTIYIQAALSVQDPQVLERERKPLMKIPDANRKIIVTLDKPYNDRDEYGIEYLSLEQFIVDPSI